MPRPRRLPFEVRIVWPGAGLGGGIPMAHVGAVPVARRRRETDRIMQRARGRGWRRSQRGTTRRAEIAIRLWSDSFWEAIERRERSTQYYVNCLSNWDRKLP